MAISACVSRGVELCRGECGAFASVGEGHAWCRLALEEAESSGNERVVLETLKTESCRSWRAGRAGSSWLRENKITKIQAVEVAVAFVAIVDFSSLCVVFQ
ncbi:hypothetical protein E2562_003521 [Oryza meyeriana var. granulata]|uniref:Uncharacterized protein n=1 Tax=Oryza meyeriana var. granulata TaxID=110450 RepID=A0A6G1CPH0_9ORYZ|nr:hypothetical protein E2562_003521 [Oryza meyeriana var. granulata]